MLKPLKKKKDKENVSNCRVSQKEKTLFDSDVILGTRVTEADMT